MEKRNLAYLKNVEITSFAPIEKSYISVEKGSKEMLTDGVTGDPGSCYGGDWAHFYRGVGRSLFIDLEDVYSVCGFDIGFIQDKGMGIYSPERVKFSLSEDGKSYYEVTTVDSPYPASFGMQVRACYGAELTQSYRARYARIDFSVEVNVFCDEVRVFGTDCQADSESLCGKLTEDIFENRYADRNSLDGAYDIPLLYFGYYPENERVARLGKEDFLPYIAYIDTDGKPIDTMFDAVLMLMVQGRCPSGGCLSYHGEPSKYSDWEFIINELFTEGYNLKALDEAVGELKKSIFPKDYKHKVYLTAPVPKVSLDPYGDMNGDGIEEKLLTTDDCIEAYCFCVDELTKRFEAECFENITLEGWFWNNESASRASRDDEEYFATRCVAELHKRGYKCIFIPYFQAGGCEKAEKIGFDCVTMQPGLSFQPVLQSDPEGAMSDFTKLCEKYGFGIELEIHHGAKNQETKELYGKLFDAYMLACIKNGMMTDTVHTYYQAAGPGVFYECAHSKDAYIRNIYDKLYKFIKGTLTEPDFCVVTPTEEQNVICDEDADEKYIPSLEETVEQTIKNTADEDLELEEYDEAPDDGLNILAIDQTEPEDAPETVPETVFEEEPEEAITFDVEPDYEPVFKTKEKPQKRRTAKSFMKKHKKKIAIGAGIAAAIGAACIIVKAIKGKDD